MTFAGDVVQLARQMGEQTEAAFEQQLLFIQNLNKSKANSQLKAYHPAANLTPVFQCAQYKLSASPRIVRSTDGELMTEYAFRTVDTGVFVAALYLSNEGALYERPSTNAECFAEISNGYISDRITHLLYQKMLESELYAPLVNDQGHVETQSAAFRARG